MIKRLTLGFAVALFAAPVLFAAPTLPGQATSRLPWQWLVDAATNALCTYFGVGC